MIWKREGEGREVVISTRGDYPDYAPGVWLAYEPTPETHPDGRWVDNELNQVYWLTWDVPVPVPNPEVPNASSGE